MAFEYLSGILTETILSGLIAPIMMIFQSSAVGEILVGRDAGWQVQRRDGGHDPYSYIVRTYSVPTFLGIVMAVSAYAVSLPLLLWMMPVILGLVLAVPIALVSSAAPSHPALFITPEQTVPPRVLTRANELANAPHSAIACPLHALRHDKDLRDAHLNNLSPKPRKRGEIDPHLAIARAKIEDAKTMDEAAGYLSRREKFAVLGNPAVLLALLALPEQQNSSGSLKIS